MAWDRAGAWDSSSKIKNLSPGADFTLTQNSVNVLTSINAGAVVNTLYLKAGNVGIGTSEPVKLLDVVRAQNAEVVIRMLNTNDGNSAAAYFVSDNGANSCRLQQHGISKSYGASGAGEGLLYQTSPGLTLMIDNANGVIKFATGGDAEKVRIDNTGKVGIGTPAPDGQLSQGLANGQQISYKSLTEVTTIANAATTVTTMSIPANVIVKAVSVRVTVAIPTAATFTVIGNTSTTAFNTAAVAVAVNSVNKGNLNCPYNNGAAQTIRITPNETPADNSGRVRVTIWYEDSIPATS